MVGFLDQGKLTSESQLSISQQQLLLLRSAMSFVSVSVFNVFNVAISMTS